MVLGTLKILIFNSKQLLYIGNTLFIDQKTTIPIKVFQLSLTIT